MDTQIIDKLEDYMCRTQKEIDKDSKDILTKKRLIQIQKNKYLYLEFKRQIITLILISVFVISFFIIATKAGKIPLSISLLCLFIYVVIISIIVLVKKINYNKIKNELIKMFIDISKITDKLLKNREEQEEQEEQTNKSPIIPVNDIREECSI